MSTYVAQQSARFGGAARDVTLLDLLDRLLQGGVVVQGDITLAVADVDLVDVSLRLILAAVESVGSDLRGELPHPADDGAGEER